MPSPRPRQHKICFVAAPTGQKGGGMGRVKDYILQSGGDRLGRIRFEALDTRGSGAAIWSIPLVLLAVLRIWYNAAFGRVALVHVNLGDRGSAVRKGIIVVMSRLVRVPVVLHLHAAELIDTYERAGRLGRWLLRIPFRAAQCCVVLGEKWRDWLAGDLGIDRAKIVILYNGVPVTPLAPAELGATAGAAPTILFLGNLMERKGVSDLLHAEATITGERPNWQAVFAGGGDLDRYQALAAELGIASRVRFVGWVDQKGAGRLIQEAAMLVLPSYDEGLPLVILEALGLGTPVICTPVGSIPEVLTDRETALLVAPGDRAGLASAVLELLDDASLRERLSAQGKALFAAEFTLDVFIDRLYDIYRRYCGIAIERVDKSVSPPGGGNAADRPTGL